MLFIPIFNFVALLYLITISYNNLLRVLFIIFVEFEIRLHFAIWGIWDLGFTSLSSSPGLQLAVGLLSHSNTSQMSHHVCSHFSASNINGATRR